MAVAGFGPVAAAGFVLNIPKCWWKQGMQEQHDIQLNRRMTILILSQIYLLVLSHPNLARLSAEKVQLVTRSQTGWDRHSWARLVVVATQVTMINRSQTSTSGSRCTRVGQCGGNAVPRAYCTRRSTACRYAERSPTRCRCCARLLHLANPSGLFHGFLLQLLHPAFQMPNQLPLTLPPPPLLPSLPYPSIPSHPISVCARSVWVP